MQRLQDNPCCTGNTTPAGRADLPTSSYVTFSLFAVMPQSERMVRFFLTSWCSFGTTVAGRRLPSRLTICGKNIAIVRGRTSQPQSAEGNTRADRKANRVQCLCIRQALVGRSQQHDAVSVGVLCVLLGSYRTLCVMQGTAGYSANLQCVDRHQRRDQCAGGRRAVAERRVLEE